MDHPIKVSTPSLAHNYGESNPAAPLRNHLIYVTTPALVYNYGKLHHIAHLWIILYMHQPLVLHKLIVSQTPQLLRGIIN